MQQTTRTAQLVASGFDETDAASPSPSQNTGREHVPLSEAGGVTVAALLHLVRLMGAEIVFARRDCDLTTFEQAVRVKLKQFNSPTGNKQAINAGIAFAHTLVDQVLTQIRAQAELKQTLRAASKQAAGAANTSVPAARRNILNSTDVPLRIYPCFAKHRRT
jgi:hypothetical protein